MFDSNAVLRDTIAENIGENKKIARRMRKYLVIIRFMKINNIEATYRIVIKKRIPQPVRQHLTLEAYYHFPF